MKNKKIVRFEHTSCIIVMNRIWTRTNFSFTSVLII